MFSFDDFKGYSLKGALKKILKSEIEELEGLIVYTDELHITLMEGYSGGVGSLFVYTVDTERFIAKYMEEFYSVFDEVGPDLELDIYEMPCDAIFTESSKFLYCTVAELIGYILRDFSEVVEKAYGFSDEVQVDDLYIKLFNTYIDNYDFSQVGL